MSSALTSELVAIVPRETRDDEMERALKLPSENDLECKLPLPEEPDIERMDGGGACRPPKADSDKPPEDDKEIAEGEVRGLRLTSSTSLASSSCC